MPVIPFGGSMPLALYPIPVPASRASHPPAELPLTTRRDVSILLSVAWANLSVRRKSMAALQSAKIAGSLVCGASR